MSPRPRQPLTTEHALLGFVQQQPLHGYDIYQRLRASQMMGLDWPLKQSQMYALLAKLEEVGYLAATLEPQGAAPPRKVLRLTKEGEAAFARWMSSPVPQLDAVQPELLAKLFFAQARGDDVALTLLMRQRSMSQGWLDHLQVRGQTQGAPTSAAWMIDQWRVRQVEALLDWLNLCIVHLVTESFVIHPIAVLNDSPQAALGQQFVDFVCGAAGQAMLVEHGFVVVEQRGIANSDCPPSQGYPASSDCSVLTVFAASVLTDAFEAIGKAFSAAMSRGNTVDVQFVFAGSQHLAQMLVAGAPGDVFAPASGAAMERVIQAGRVRRGGERVFARNRLVVVTPKDNPAHLASLRDLAQPGVKLVLGSESTAIGQYSMDFLAQAERVGSLPVTTHAAVLQNVIGYEPTVRDVLDRVMRGEADAGIIFRSDYQPQARGSQLTAIGV